MDVRTADQTVTVRVRAVDWQAGLRSVLAVFWSRDTGWTRDLRLVSGYNGMGSGKPRSGCAAASDGRARCALSSCSPTTPGAGGTTPLRDSTTKGGPAGSRSLRADHIPPLAGVSFRPVPVAGPITLRFSEDVNGITTTSVLVRQLIGDFDHGPPVPGTWACRDAASALTDCQTGMVRVARFRPTDPLAARAGVHRDTESRVLPGRDRPGGQPIPPRGALRLYRATGVTAPRTQQSERRPGGEGPSIDPRMASGRFSRGIRRFPLSPRRRGHPRYGPQRRNPAFSQLSEHGRAVPGTASAVRTSHTTGRPGRSAGRAPAADTPDAHARWHCGRPTRQPGIARRTRRRSRPAAYRWDIETDAQGRFRFTVRRLSGMSRFRMAVMAFAVTPPLSRLILTGMLRGSRHLGWRNAST